MPICMCTQDDYDATDYYKNLCTQDDYDATDYYKNLLVMILIICPCYSSSTYYSCGSASYKVYRLSYKHSCLTCTYPYNYTFLLIV